MGQEVLRVHMRAFPGIGRAGEALLQPVRPLSETEWMAFFYNSENLFAPTGVLTNKDVGWTVEHDGSGVSGAWEWQGYLDASDGSRDHVGINNGIFYSRGALSATWTSVKTGLGTGKGWHSKQYQDWLFLASSAGDLYVYDGTNLYPWMISAIDASSVTATPTGTGSITLSTGWSYRFRYARSSDGWKAPASTDTASSGTASAVASVDLAAIPGTGEDGVDKIDIFRTTDGGAVYRYLDQVGNPGASSTTTYSDSTTDANLSLTELNTLTALEPFTASMLAVLADRIYVADIVEDGASRAWRIRWCYPGQPWRFEVYDYTDEAEKRVVGLALTDAGLVVFTPKRARTLSPAGGGAHIFGAERWPGATDSHLITEVDGGVAWVGPGNNIYLNGENISDPPAGARSGVEDILLNYGQDAWIKGWAEYVPSKKLIVFGVEPGGSEPDEMLLFDISRLSWWRTTYGGSAPVIVAVGTGGKPDTLLLGMADGTTRRAFDGEKAGPAELPPKLVLGPTDFGLEHKKRFRHAQVHMDVSETMTLRVIHQIDNGARSGVDTATYDVTGDTLGIDFMLGSSLLVSEQRTRHQGIIGDSGDYLTLDIEKTVGVGVVKILAIDVKLQVLAT